MIEGEQMLVADAIVDGSRSVPVVIGRAEELIGLFAWRAQRPNLAAPVVFIVRSVDIVSDVVVVVSRQHHVQPLRQQIALAVFHRRHQRIALAVFRTEHHFLAHTRLYVLVHVGSRETERQPVGPAFADNSDFCHDSLIVIHVVETLHCLLFPHVDSSRRKILHRSFYLVVVVGIILEKVYLIHQSVFECLPEINKRLVGVKRTVRIGSIQKPAVFLFLCNDIDDTADGIRAEPNRNHSPVNFNTLGKIHRYIIEAE